MFLLIIDGMNRVSHALDGLLNSLATRALWECLYNVDTPFGCRRLNDTLRLYMLRILLDTLHSRTSSRVDYNLVEQLSEGRVRKVEILVDSRPGAILSAVSNLQRRLTAALKLQHLLLRRKEKRSREPV